MESNAKWNETPFPFTGFLAASGTSCSLEFECSTHQEKTRGPPLQLEGNSAVTDWYGEQLAHDNTKFLCSSCYLTTIDRRSLMDDSTPNTHMIDYEEMAVAVFDSNLTLVKKYLELKSQANKKSLLTDTDDAGVTLLHCAAIIDNADILKYLVEMGARVDAKDRCSISPLHWAAWHGNSAGVDCLLEAGANVFSRDITGRLPLHYACWSGSASCVTLFSVKSGFPESVAIADFVKWTPLHYAVLARSYEGVQILLNHNADIHVTCNNNLNPFCLAPFTGSMEIEQTMVKRSTKLNKKTELLRAISSENDNDLTLQLIKNNKDWDYMGLSAHHMAALLGNLSLIKLLVTSESDTLNTLDTRCKRSMLHWAVIGDHADVVEYLLSIKANSFTEDYFQHNCIKYVFSHGWTNTLSLTTYLEMLDSFCKEFLIRRTFQDEVDGVRHPQVNTELFLSNTETFDDPMSISVRTSDINAIAKLLLYGVGLHDTPCPLLYYPTDGDKEILTWILMLFLASDYSFGSVEARKKVIEFVSVDNSVIDFTNYIEQGVVCLEEAHIKLPISPLKMVLDRNENHDYDDVVELLMLGEVKAHLKNGCLIDDNLKQEPSDDENSISAKVSDYINKFISWLPLTKKHIWYLATILPLLGEYGVGFGMYCLDVYSDLDLAIELINKPETEHTDYKTKGYLVMAFTLVPQTLIGILLGVQYLRMKGLGKVSLMFSIACFVGLGPAVVAVDTFLATWEWVSEGTKIGGTAKKKSKSVADDKPPQPLGDKAEESKERWNALRIWEASLESGPEMILQLHIAMCTGEYSLLSLALSFISLVQAAAEYYHAKASGAVSFIPNILILSVTTTFFLISRILSILMFTIKYGYVLIVPISIFMLSLIVDIAISWKQAKNKAMHITMYISSLFILVRSKFERNSTAQQIMFYSITAICNGLLVIPVINPPKLGDRSSSSDCYCFKTCGGVSINGSSNIIYNNESVIFQWFGEDLFSDWWFIYMSPAVVASTFVIGISVMVVYLLWFHPWRHIIGTEPRFKVKNGITYSKRFITGILVSFTLCLCDVALLGMISVRMWDSVIDGMGYFIFPYVVCVFAGIITVILSLTDNSKTKSTIKKQLLYIVRPNFILTLLVNIYKISAIQGSILIGLLEVYIRDYDDPELTVMKWCYIGSVLAGIGVTVYLYDDSSLTNKTAISQSEGKSEGNINGGQSHREFNTMRRPSNAFHKLHKVSHQQHVLVAFQPAQPPLQPAQPPFQPTQPKRSETPHQSPKKSPKLSKKSSNHHPPPPHPPHGLPPPQHPPGPPPHHPPGPPPNLPPKPKL